MCGVCVFVVFSIDSISICGVLFSNFMYNFCIFWLIDGGVLKISVKAAAEKRDFFNLIFLVSST